MAFEIFAGIIISFLAKNWPTRIADVALVGLWTCVELFLLKRKAFSSLEKKELKHHGLPEDEIDETAQAIKDLNDYTFKEMSLTGWKFYVW